MEDLCQGIGKVDQKRGLKNYKLGKVDVPYSVSSIDELKNLDVTKFNSARVFNGLASYREYYYNESDSSGIIPNKGTGSWIERVSESATGDPGEDGDTIQVFLNVSNGLFFKNNTGPNKVVTADLYLNGVLVEDTTNFIYRWLANDQLMYLDSGNNFVSTTPSVGLFPADKDGINTQSIVIDSSDVEDGSNLQIKCEISNF